MRATFGTLLFSAACVLGCGDGSSGPSVEPRVLALGTGEVRFENIPADRHLPLHAGTQGGHHVWLSMRVEGLDPEQIVMTLDVVPEAPAPPAHTEVELTFEPAAGDPATIEFVGWPARVLSAECAVGKPVHLTVSLEDQSGRTAEAEMQVIADPPKTGFPAPCEAP